MDTLHCPIEFRHFRSYKFAYSLGNISKGLAANGMRKTTNLDLFAIGYTDEPARLANDGATIWRIWYSVADR
jgi:hypothetical protein